jgi:hypothetical protein
MGWSWRCDTRIIVGLEELRFEDGGRIPPANCEASDQRRMPRRSSLWDPVFPVVRCLAPYRGRIERPLVFLLRLFYIASWRSRMTGMASRGSRGFGDRLVVPSVWPTPLSARHDSAGSVAFRAKSVIRSRAFVGPDRSPLDG